MSETHFGRFRKVLAFAAAAQFGTGIALMALPSVVVALLVRAEITDLAMLLGRCLGIALLALGLACWPERQAEPSSAAFRGMFAYNALIALFFGYVGAVLHIAGPLLWPAAAAHAVFALLLPWTRHDMRRKASGRGD